MIPLTKVEGFAHLCGFVRLSLSLSLSCLYSNCAVLFIFLVVLALFSHANALYIVIFLLFLYSRAILSLISFCCCCCCCFLLLLLIIINYYYCLLACLLACLGLGLIFMGHTTPTTQSAMPLVALSWIQWPGNGVYESGWSDCVRSTQ